MSENLPPENVPSGSQIGNSSPDDNNDVERRGGTEDEQRKMWPQFFSCFVATLGSFLMGTAIGWSGPAIPLLERNDTVTANYSYEYREGIGKLSNVQISLIGSFMPLGALFGGIAAGVCVQKVGRKYTMIGGTLGFTIGYLLLVTAQNIVMILIGRLFTGFCSGLVSIAAPMYIAETASTSVRGFLGSSFQVMVTMGVFYVDVLGLTYSWRWLSVGCIVVCLVSGVLLTQIHETPTYLLSKNKIAEARRSLEFLNGYDEIDADRDIMAIRHSLADNASSNRSSFKELFCKRQNLKPLVISLVLMFGQQFSGINAILFFSVNIFEAAGTSLNSFVESIILASVQVVATLLSALLMDRAGRKVLLLVSSGVMAVAEIALGAFFWISTHDPEKAKSLEFIPLTSLCVFVCFFSLGFGPIPWLMVGELFSPEIKGKASSIAACTNWSLAFLVTQLYAPLQKSMGQATTFWIFSSCLVLVFLFCLFFVPETKGKSLAEIQEMFRNPQGEEEEDRQIFIYSPDDDQEEVEEEDQNISNQNEIQA